ncbi:HelD family protein [Georgenia muralis]|uniref:DNA helicase IV n=1 Tax=Georgenia muralis TaxID=154117 RepID=A0A3N4ZUB1_9MICO|nr:ATP-binding domain-containing protein [Georgenia muralis]RPF29018.1 DNA helicase IV [Georgenia muralis]
MSVTDVAERQSVLDQEQRYFDDAFHHREAKRLRQAEQWKAAANPKDGAALKAAGNGALGSPEEAVAFAKYETTDEQTFYVGMHLITDDARDIVVYPWQAPRVMKLREATPEAPADVARIVSFTTTANTIVDFDERVLAEIADRLSELDNPDTVLIREDELLNDALGRQRTPEMRQIVQTIQAAQSALIRSPRESLLIIQGGPGTGKTAVALHRVSWLLYNYSAGRTMDVLDPDDVLVVGPNPTFTRYIKQVLPELGDNDVVQTDVASMLETGVRASRKESGEVARVKGDLRMLDIISQGLQDRIRPLREPVRLKAEGFPWSVEVTERDVQPIVARTRSMTYNRGRSRFREELLAFLAGQATRTLKRDGGVYRGDTRQLFQTVEVDAIVERVWPQLSAQAFLRDLFGSLARLVSAAPPGFPVDQLQLLQRPPAGRLSEERWSKEDLVLLDAVQAELSGEPIDYAHIVVDEAQDLSPMQLSAIRLRSRTGSMTIVGDIAQSTGFWARDSWDDVVEILQSPLPVRRESLTHGYRVPRSVLALASNLLDERDAQTLPSVIVRDVEPGPELHEVAASADLAEATLETVKHHSARGHFVGVVCPANRREALEAAFRSAGIMWSDADRGGLTAAINIVSPPAAKGLEFDAVVVVDPAAIAESGPQGDRMLYIAMTRTTHYLDIVYPAGTLSPALGGTQPEDGAVDDPATAIEQSVLKEQQDAAVSAPADAQAATRSGGPLGDDPRSRMVKFAAQELLGQLRDTVGPALWRDALGEAIRLLDNDVAR